MKLSLPHARRLWAHAQGLLAPSDAPLHEVVAATGWLRTLGGAEAYLALAARSSRATVPEVAAALRRRELLPLPSVRGCIYLVPAADAPLSLGIARQLSEARIARDLAKVGVSPAELQAVGEAALVALEGGPRSTRQLSQDLPRGLSRSLGEAGKKVGLSSTLPPALRQLELEQRIVRQAEGDRIDHERYDWALSPLPPSPVEDLHRELARRFFAWAGPATPAAFGTWSGLNKGQARAAIAGAGLRAVDVEGLGEALIHPEALDAALPPGQVAWLPALDNLAGLKEQPAPLVDGPDAELEVGNFGRPPTTTLGQASNLFERSISQEGRIVGLWGWDPQAGSPVVRSFAGSPTPPPALAEIFGALGHSKRFLLDTESTLQVSLARLRRTG